MKEILETLQGRGATLNIVTVGGTRIPSVTIKEVTSDCVILGYSGDDDDLREWFVPHSSISSIEKL